MSNQAQTNRRSFFRGVAAAGMSGVAAAPAQGQKIPRMKITSVEPILTGRDVFLKIETDAGIVGYGEATNNFIP